MDTNFKHVAFSREAVGEKLNISVIILLKDPTQHEPLVTALNLNNFVVKDDLTYTFVAEQINQMVRESESVEPIDTQMLKISFDSINLEVILPFLAQQMLEHGYSLDLQEYYAIRNAAFRGAEKDYLQRAFALLPSLRDKQNSLITLEYNLLTQIIFELPKVLRESFVGKLAAKLRQENLAKCAEGLAALFTNLQSTETAALRKKTLPEILNAPVTFAQIPVVRIDYAFNDDEKILQLAFQDKDYEACFLARLSKAKTVTLGDKTYKLNVKIAPTANAPIENAVTICVPNDDSRFILLEYMFMQIEKFGCMLESPMHSALRKGFGFSKPEHLLKFAGAVAHMIKSKGDEPALAEFNWLARMACEVPVPSRDEFIYDVACLLCEKGLNSCALALSIVYANSSICTELQSMVVQLQKNLALSEKQPLRFAARQPKLQIAELNLDRPAIQNITQKSLFT